MSAPTSEASSPIPGARPPAQKKSGVVIPHRAKWQQRLAARLIWLFVHTLAATIRFKLDDRSGYFSGAPKEALIFATWHNRLALALMLYERHVRQYQPDRHLACLVSASKDGGLLARVMELFNVEPVRGSSSRRGAQALRELVKWGNLGHDLAITPDGPRGPCYVVRDGVVATAQLTGLAIVPVSYHLNWKIRLKSWDRFQLPLPFARCEITTGQVLRVPREATEAERETLRQQFEAELRAITRD
jgi:lysophospholipid acyltransferase (LPLAT)-like uncharacterized protein